MDKHLKIMIMMAIAIITFSLFYYFVIFLPAEKKAIKEQQAQAFVEEKKKQETEKAQREQIEMEKMKSQENMLIRQKMADNQRRQALGECLDRVNQAYAKMDLSEMSNYEAERYLPHILELKKREEEKCFRFYGEK